MARSFVERMRTQVVRDGLRGMGQCLWIGITTPVKAAFRAWDICWAILVIVSGLDLMRMAEREKARRGRLQKMTARRMEELRRTFSSKG